MVAHSLCKFGGGEKERELEAYHEIHFPALTFLKKTTKLPSPVELRSEGLCPLTPEEAVLMLAALGFSRKTRVFVAGAQIYGGIQRLVAMNSLYPYLVTKENLLSANELEPFKNFSSQLAALDFIGCTAANAFAMTDSGSPVVVIGIWLSNKLWWRNDANNAAKQAKACSNVHEEFDYRMESL